MPLTSIVTICLRIFALNWLVYGVIDVVSLISTGRSSVGLAADYSILWSALITVVVGVLIWMWSRTIARLVTPRPEAEVQFSGLSIQNLYIFAFTFLGLYFVLCAIPPLINFLYYMAVQASEEPNAGVRSQNFYNLTHNVLTLMVGGACLLLGPRIAVKLANAHAKQSGKAQTISAEAGSSGGSAA